MEGFELRDLDLRQMPHVEREYESEDDYFALDIDTAVNHVIRHEGDYSVISNNDYEDILKADLGEFYLEVANYTDGGTTVVFASDRVPEPVVEDVYGKRINKLVERERGVRSAARMFLNTQLPVMAEAGRTDEVEALAAELGGLGDGLEDIAESYFDPEDSPDLSRVFLPYSFFFELKEDQSADDNFHESLSRETPLAEAYSDECKRERNTRWLKKYLETVVEQTVEKHGSEQPTESEAYLRELAIGMTPELLEEHGVSGRKAQAD